MKLLGIISAGFNITDQLQISFFALSDTGEKLEYISHSQTSGKLMIQLGWKYCTVFS
jgi:hypothetical protein